MLSEGSRISWVNMGPLGNWHHPRRLSLALAGLLSLISLSDDGLCGTQNNPPFITLCLSLRTSAFFTNVIMLAENNFLNNTGQSASDTLWHAGGSLELRHSSGTCWGISKNCLSRDPFKWSSGFTMPACTGRDILSGSTSFAPQHAASIGTLGS